MIDGLDAYDLSELTVLVVDDNEHMLRLAGAMLRGLGVSEVYKEKDATQALNSGVLEKVDIVLSDWLMEPIGGIDFVRKLRDRNNSVKPFVPIIMMCGFTERKHVIKARDTGITEFLSIPISSKLLYERVVHVVQHPRPFVDAPGFFGPDRRRKEDRYHTGGERRVSQPDIIDENVPDGVALDMATG